MKWYPEQGLMLQRQLCKNDDNDKRKINETKILKSIPQIIKLIFIYNRLKNIIFKTDYLDDPASLIHLMLVNGSDLKLQDNMNIRCSFWVLYD
jgi:hypothetical protein